MPTSCNHGRGLAFTGPVQCHGGNHSISWTPQGWMIQTTLNGILGLCSPTKARICQNCRLVVLIIHLPSARAPISHGHPLGPYFIDQTKETWFLTSNPSASDWQQHIYVYCVLYIMYWRNNQLLIMIYIWRSKEHTFSFFLAQFRYISTDFWEHIHFSTPFISFHMNSQSRNTCSANSLLQITISIPKYPNKSTP